MSARLYDYIVTVADATNYREGNTVIGATTKARGIIANVDYSANTIKVKMANIYQEFAVSETLWSNHRVISNTYSVDTITAPSYANVNTTYTLAAAPISKDQISVEVNRSKTWRNYVSLKTNKISFSEYFFPKPGDTVNVITQTGNANAEFFQSSNSTLISAEVTSASSTISAIKNSPFIATTNSFTQSPIVRLIDIYYPGEWYPPNSKGNPTNSGKGYAWPVNMPIRLAEVIGDFHSDLSYNVTYGGQSYIPYPMEFDGINISSDGTIDRVNLTVANYDNLITDIVENPYIIGYAKDHVAYGTVNGELVYGLDPRTVTTEPAYDQNIVDTIYGGVANSPWLYSSAASLNYNWKNLKTDSRDLLGAVIEIKTTFANHLKYWPEHSKIDYISSNVVSVINSGPYRPGDNVKTTYSTNTVQINDIQDDRLLVLSTPLTNVAVGENLYIVNDEYDEDAYVSDVFKITKLNKLDDKAAEFELTSWLQYFKLQLPRRKFYKNTCQWVYKGTECQYPGPGGLSIPGTTKLSNTYPITQANQQGVLAEEDECAKSFQACKLRNNTVHFGAFPGTGRTIPRQ